MVKVSTAHLPMMTGSEGGENDKPKEITIAQNDGRVDRASASGTVDSGVRFRVNSIQNMISKEVSILFKLSVFHQIHY